MGKKVLIIDGSARRMNTYGILLQIERILNAQGIDTEILNLYDYNIEDCVGCETCVNGKSCGIADDMPMVLKKILDSDGVVLGSPVYMGGATSRFKAFADRTNIWVHKPETAGKPVMFVTTTMSTGLKEMKRFFTSFAVGFGARVGDFVSRTVNKAGVPVQESELSRFIKLLNEDKSNYAPKMNEIIMFNVGKVLAKKSKGYDNQFWADKHWFDMKYYYDCRMNPAKNLFSSFMLKVLIKAIG